MAREPTMAAVTAGRCSSQAQSGPGGLVSQFGAQVLAGLDTGLHPRPGLRGLAAGPGG
jgi:hypothetical protein